MKRISSLVGRLVVDTLVLEAFHGAERKARLWWARRKALRA